MRASSNIIVEQDVDQLTNEFGKQFKQLVNEYRDSEPISIFLAGGGTPRPFHRHIASEYRDALPWEQVHFFWGDERLVPLDHEDSNFKMAKETLLDDLAVPEENIHPVKTDAESPEAAARAYEETITSVLPRTDDSTVPVADLILLGLGSDGHTASLFPGAPQLQNDSNLVAGVPNPPAEHDQQRVTITFPFINNAKHVWFLVTGERKRETVRTILEDRTAPVQTHPAIGVNPSDGPIWWLDEAACPEAFQ